MSASSMSRKVYGTAKTRDMVRSVLASKNRRTARTDLDAIRRRARRAARSRLSAWHGRVDVALEALAADDDADILSWPQGAIAEAVAERRQSDKLGPIMAWARARTRHLPQADRLDALRPALPDTLPGRHALSHLEWLADLRVPADPPRWFLRAPVQRRSSRDRVPAVADVARRALADGRHADLNRWLKRNGPVLMRDDAANTDTVLLLGGLHDIDAFARSTASHRDLAEALIAHRWGS